MTAKEKFSLTVEPRKVTGRRVKTLRRQGILPANIFGAKIKSAAVQLKLDDFIKVFQKAGETNVVYLTVKGQEKESPVLISNIQFDPISDQPLHADLHQIDLTQKVTATVPVKLVGTAPAVEEKGAVLVQLVNELEVEALPTDLPDALEIDITPLKEFGDFLTVKDFKVDTVKVNIEADLELQVVQTQEPKAEEIPAPAPEVEAPVSTEETEPQAPTPPVAPEAV